MGRVHRRRFLAQCGGIATILATGRAPAFGQGTTLHWLRVNDFVPASDAFLRKELLPEAEKALGFKINLETINGNDVQPRIAAAIQSGAGADMVNAFNNWAQLYAESVVDVSDVAEEIGKAQGGYYDLSNRAGPAMSSLARRAVVRVGHPHLLSQVVVRGGGFCQVSGNLGAISRGRQEAQGQGTSDRPDARPHLSGTRPPSHTPTCGPGAAGRSRRMARRSCSTARRPSSRSSSCRASGRTRTTKAGLPGMTATTTAPSSRAPSARPATRHRSTSRACARPTSTRLKRARR